MRTGPLNSTCSNCGDLKTLCNCRNCPIRQQIRTINHIRNLKAREDELKAMLRMQKKLLGLIISQPNDKCIGMIDKKGNIKHCDAKDATGPYRIIIKPTTNDAIPYASACITSRTLGQCIDRQGHTIAEILRKNHRNHLALTKKSTAPVMAVVIPSEKPVRSPLASDLDQLIRESKALIENTKSM